MNKLAIALATLISLAVIGCSQQENPLTTDTSTSSVSIPHITTPPGGGNGGGNNGNGGGNGGNTGGGSSSGNGEMQLIGLPDYDRIDGATSITQRITAAQGGSLKLKVFYMKNGLKVGSVSATIKFQIGTLVRDEDITISLDPVSLGLTFGPHGTVFNKPALLTIDTDGLDLTQFKQDADLYYVVDGEWVETYQAKFVKVMVPQGKLTVNEVQLRHFSQYAFGRRR